MPAALRWILGMLIAVLGLGAAAFTVLGGVFSTVGCLEVPSDWVYYVLLTAGALAIVAGVTPAALIVRKARPARIVITAIAASVFLCSAVVAYFVLLGQYC